MMTPERLRLIETVFHEIRDHCPEDREAALAAACGDDVELLRVMESLLGQTPSVLIDASFDAAVANLGTSVGVRRHQPGERIGTYVLGPLLGAGGMGEVYRARDVTLDRDVAIKFMPDVVAADSGRLTRFEREAHTLASLNHPHIGAIYGLIAEASVRGLVLEFVEGDTLADRLERGPLSTEVAVDWAIQIADALEAAHEKGIIHRDLKPANIKITAGGAVKVLDFGLAKIVAGPDGGAEPLSRVTREGAIVGTAGYMSPEQARGLTVDRRTDVWAFGCVLYEMLTARAAFAAGTHSDTIAAVLQTDPDWLRLPPETPPAIERLLRRCLEKEPSRRLRDIGDARLEVEETLAAPALGRADTRDRDASQRRRTVWLVAGLCLAATVASGAVAALIRAGAGDRTSGITRVLVGVSPADELTRQPTRTEVAFSPDGRTLVFSATKGRRQELYARAIDRLEATPIPGTESSNSPFLSPDGEWLGFWSGQLAPGSTGELKKVRLSGGPVVTICRAAPLFGASWSADDVIVFANSAGGLWMVPAAGGTPTPLTTLDVRKGEYSHRLPHALPGGKAVLFTILKNPTAWDEAQVVALTRATGAQTVLINGGADSRYIATGHVVYARGGILMAVPFDVTRLIVTGPPVGILDGVMQAENAPNVTLRETGAAQFAISGSGDLAYLPGGVFPSVNRSLVWVGRNGGIIDTLPVPPRPYLGARLSPDDSKVAVSVLGSDKTTGVWIFDSERRAFTQLTSGGRSLWPAWTPDGTRVTTSSMPAAPGLVSLSVDGSVAPERLLATDRSLAGSWSPDGTDLAFVKFRETGGAEIWIWSREKGERRLRLEPDARVNERYPTFSPDGRWIAYTTDESGRDQVYVQRYPGSGERHQVSLQSGTQPVWARNGHELFYTERDPANTKMMAVDMTLRPTFSAREPRLLFEGSYSFGTPHRNVDVTADGRRFLMMRDVLVPVDSPQTHIVLVQNWGNELRQRVTARK
jgi:serine/threonine-protein kinase